MCRHAACFFKEALQEPVNLGLPERLLAFWLFSRVCAEKNKSIITCFLLSLLREPPEEGWLAFQGTHQALAVPVIPSLSAS